MYLSRIQLTDDLLKHTQLGAMLRKSGYGMHQLLWDLFETGSRHLFREECSREQLGTRHKRPLFYVLSGQSPKTDSRLFDIECKPFRPSLAAGEKLAFKLRANPTICRHVEGKKRSCRHDVVMDAKYHHLLRECLKCGLLSEKEVFLRSDSGRQYFKENLNRTQLQKQLLAQRDFAVPEVRESFFQQQAQAVEQAANHWLEKKGERCGFTINSVETTGYLWRSLANVKQKRNAGYSSLEYQGVLTVTDAPLFLAQLNRGFGTAKGFGCGLMMIRPV